MSDSLSLPPKPRFRGVSHQYAFMASIVGACFLLWSTTGVSEFITHLIFALSVCNLFGVSAAYHRIHWDIKARARMRRLDHIAIYLLIAGSYTPVMVATLDTEKAFITLAVVYGASAIGIFLELGILRAPKWFKTLIYVAIGWVAIFVAPDIIAAIGWSGAGLIVAGGVLYTIGALVYAAKRPNPAPEVFGYHEIFHLFVVVAVTLHYLVVAFFLPGSVP